MLLRPENEDYFFLVRKRRITRTMSESYVVAYLPPAPLKLI